MEVCAHRGEQGEGGAEDRVPHDENVPGQEERAHAGHLHQGDVRGYQGVGRRCGRTQRGEFCNISATSLARNLNNDFFLQEEDGDESEEEDDTEAAGNKPKTRKQRRKEKEAKAASAARGRVDAEKKKNQDLFRMKSLKKSIAKQEALTAQRIEKRKQAKEVGHKI